ncbi:hypothetical protein Y032_0014g2295 [Ancylostoma ceylanicum]|uniref:Uncharacterized protein n=1 Tax=Ancylostoma ceylanicum TaxID=53326 RepID=A0A016V8W2_9BILA|nr:hypothetical protein Y032_0014g2295 [Ancylostoma ceylanicum]
MSDGTYFIWTEKNSSCGYQEREQEYPEVTEQPRPANLLSNVPVLLYYSAASVIFVMLIVFWLLFFHLYPLSVFVPVVILSFSGYLLLFVNIKIACLDPSQEASTSTHFV